MRKRTKILAIVVAAVLVLTLGLTTIAFASGSSEEEGDGDKGPRQTFISKVASILGLEEEQVTDAFRQARREMCDEALEQRLQKAVENGFLTQEQAEQILEWWQNRPDVMEGFCPPPGHPQLRGREGISQVPGPLLRHLPLGHQAGPLLRHSQSAPPAIL
jgi:hypothetical protein